MKIPKKFILIWGIFVILLGVGLILRTILFRKNSEIPAWIDSNWLYRRTVAIENTGGAGSNEDVLVTVDTASLISAGKMRSNCEDFRFTDSDDGTYLSYWIEDDCNTSSTKIWVKIPSIPSGGKNIYMYYGNSSASAGTLSWGGNIYMYSDSTCPVGWSQATEMNNRFLVGTNSFGTAGGSDTHSHSTASCTSGSPTVNTGVYSASGTVMGSTSTHTHTLYTGFDTVSNLPPYKGMILCYRNKFTINSGLISVFAGDVPSGYTRFSDLDGYFPRVMSSAGSVGGSSTHTHTAVVSTASTTASTQGTSVVASQQGTGGTITTVGSDKVHRFTASGTFTAPTAFTVRALVVAGGGGGGNIIGGGGGAGGMIENTSLSLTAGSYTVTVGGGGAATGKGGNSVFGSLITAYGGGAGGTYPTTYASSGGSGGGGTGSYYTQYNQGASGTSGQGNAGGTGGGTGSVVDPYVGGGGGGAGYAATGSNGGNGKASSITGTSVTYAGGGGGRMGTGGTGGGGNGAQAAASGSPGTNGLGGGGGGSSGNGTYGGKGGSGVVVIRYGVAPSTTVASSNHTHTTVAVANSISASSHIPVYFNTVFGKANSDTYVTNNNVLMTSAYPPLGYEKSPRFDYGLVFGSSTYGLGTGSTEHNHTLAIGTYAPSATTTVSSGSAASFGSSNHTHSCSSSSSSISNLPAFYSVIYIQRKTSKVTTVGIEMTPNQPPASPSQLLCESQTNPINVMSTTPAFSGIFSDINTPDTGIYYQIQVNTSSDFTGTVMWDSNKTAFATPVTNATRSPNISYAGNTLTLNGTTYYWRMKFWDNLDTESAWSSTSQFTMYNNVPPTFTSISVTPSVNPGGTVEYSAVASDPNANNVKLLVCSTAGVSGTSCSGTTICESSLVSSNPSCSKVLDAVKPSGSYDAYVYVFNSFDYPSSSALQGSSKPYTVSNTAPLVTSLSLNSGLPITLSSGTTTQVVLYLTVLDYNSCTNSEITSVIGSIYRDGIGYAGCDSSSKANNNNCYPDITCTEDAGSCTDITDSSSTYTCTGNIQYFADATDTDSQFSADSWRGAVKATDKGSLVSEVGTSTTVELNSLLAFNVTESIQYEDLKSGESNPTLNKRMELTSRGNVGITPELSGTPMCTDYPTCEVGTQINVGSQRYASATVAYTSGNVLTTIPVTTLMLMPKQTNAASAVTLDIWWGIQIPYGMTSGLYNGSLTVTGVKSNANDW